MYLKIIIFKKLIKPYPLVCSIHQKNEVASIQKKFGDMQNPQKCKRISEDFTYLHFTSSKHHSNKKQSQDGIATENSRICERDIFGHGHVAAVTVAVMTHRVTLRKCCLYPIQISELFSEIESLIFRHFRKMKKDLLQKSFSSCWKKIKRNWQI